jgi:hypothetical protein
MSSDPPTMQSEIKGIARVFAQRPAAGDLDPR